jgi:hypothetical protein
MPATFPVEYTYGLRPTRPGVLDVKKIDTLIPGKQLFPNHVVLPQPPTSYRKVLDLTREAFGISAGTAPDRMEDRGKAGVMIDVARAAALVKPIKTRSRNIWRDSTIANVIAKVAEKFGGQVMLRMRTAKRTIGAEGFISTGMLFGGEVTSARQANVPTLWIIATTTTAESEGGAGQLFAYPTFIIPDSYPTLFMFNRSQ